MDVAVTVAAARRLPQTEEHLTPPSPRGPTRHIRIAKRTRRHNADRGVREEIEIAADSARGTDRPSDSTGEARRAPRQDRQRWSCRRRAAAAGFRSPDRAFVLHGHGVVVTGTAIAGTVREGDTLRILPGGETARVRSLEVHGVAVPRAEHGQRVAINLAGVERSDIGRGHVVCDTHLGRLAQRIDARVEIRPAARKEVASHTRVRVHIGTAETLARLVVLGESRAIAPRAAGWVQLVLAEPILALRGDRFILRDETARRTLGGGEVVNPFADRHRRAETDVGERLARLRGADLATAALAFLDLAPEFATDRATIAQALNVREDEAGAALVALDVVVPIPDRRAAEAYTTDAKWRRLEDDVCGAVVVAHRDHPLASGVEMETLRAGLAWEVPAKIFRWCVDRLVASRRLAREDSIVRAPGHRVALGADARVLGKRVEELLAAGRFTPPDLRQLEETAGVARNRLVEVLGVLEGEGRVVRVAPDLYFARAAADEARGRIEAHCRAHGEITAAAFRDLIGASRKFAIAFLDWCDRTGTTVRVGDVRKLRR
jgi:selenocysteine-specific elongation factor